MMLTFILERDTGVGKSCILCRFSDNEFRERTGMTIGVEFGTRTININGATIKLQVWDTAGQESFASITRSYYRGAVGALLVYDVTKRSTFHHLKVWQDETKKNAPESLVTILVGNKCDLDRRRQVSTKEGEDFARENGMLFVETSAKSAENIDLAFIQVSRLIYDRIMDGTIDISQQTDLGIKKGFGAQGVDVDGKAGKKRCC